MRGPRIDCKQSGSGPSSFSAILLWYQMNIMVNDTGGHLVRYPFWAEPGTGDSDIELKRCQTLGYTDPFLLISDIFKSSKALSLSVSVLMCMSTIFIVMQHDRKHRRGHEC